MASGMEGRRRAEARRRGVDIDDAAWQFRANHFDEFDLVLAMDDENVRNLHRLSADPALRVLVLQGVNHAEDFSRLAEHDVVFTTYPLLWRDAEELMQHSYHLLILDEVMSAWGRAGYWFACEKWGVVPDMIVTAKGITTSGAATTKAAWSTGEPTDALAK